MATKDRSEIYISDILRNLESIVQLQKDEKHPLRSVTFSKVAGLGRGC